MSVFNQVLEEWAYPFQLEWLRCQNKWASYLKARQLGITTVTALLVLGHCARHRKHPFYLVGTTENLAAEILTVVRDFWLPKVMHADWADQVFPLRKNNTTQIHLANGSRIIAMPSKPDNFRGLVGSFLWDEAAYLRDRDMRKIADAIFPIIDNENNPNCIMRVISTPWWAEGLFHEIHTDPNKQYQQFSRFRTDIHEAIKQGYPFDASKLYRMPPARAGKEYLCKFASGGSGFFVRSRLMDLIERDRPKRIEQFGIDLGKKNDLTAIVGRSGKVVGPTWIIEGMGYDKQLDIVSDLIRKEDPAIVVVDSTRNETFSDVLKSRFGSKIKGRHWTHGWKKRAVERVDVDITNGDLRVYGVTHEWDGEDPKTGTWKTSGRLPIIDDLSNVEQKKTPSGLVTYDFPRDKAREISGQKFKGHGDAAAAMLMARDEVNRLGALGKARKLGGSTRNPFS